MNVVISNARIISAPYSRVVIGGSTRPDIECVSLNIRGGRGGSDAQLRWIGQRPGVSTDSLDGAKVVIYAGRSSADASVVFRGWILAPSQAEGKGGSSVTFSVRSPIALLTRRDVGDQTPVAGREYDPEDGWTIRTALEDIAFRDVGSLFGGEVSLDLSALGNFGENPVPKTTFLCSNVIDGIHRFLDSVPGAVLCERFEAEGTRLEVVDVSSLGGDAVRVYRACTTSQNPEQGALVLGYSSRRDFSKYATRAYVWGAPTRYQLTFGTDDPPAVEGGPAYPTIYYLEPAWENASSYREPVLELTADEEAVLRNPDIAKPGSPSFDPERGDIFRKFRISSEWETISPDLCAVGADGNNMRPQAFQERVFYMLPNEGGGGTSGDMEFDPNYGKILRPRWDDVSRVFEFDEPIVDVIATTPGASAGDPTTFTFDRANVWITCAVSKFSDRKLGAAELAPGLGFDLLSSAQLPSAKYEQIGDDATGCIYADESLPEGERVIIVPDGEPVIVTDDSEILQAIADAAINQMGKPNERIDILLPGVHRVDVGERFRVLNRGIDATVFFVCETQISLRENTTRISGSTVVDFKYTTNLEYATSRAEARR